MGFLGIVVVRLLQLRMLSQQEPEQLASTVVPGELIEILQVRLRRVSPEPMQLGGVLAIGGQIGGIFRLEIGWATGLANAMERVVEVAGFILGCTVRQR